LEVHEQCDSKPCGLEIADALRQVLIGEMIDAFISMMSCFSTTRSAILSPTFVLIGVDSSQEELLNQCAFIDLLQEPGAEYSGNFNCGTDYRF